MAPGLYSAQSRSSKFKICEPFSKIHFHEPPTLAFSIPFTSKYSSEEAKTI